MRLYHNRSFFRVVLEISGSVVWKCTSIISGVLLAGVSAFLQWMIDEDLTPYRPDLPHHYGMHALGVIVAFAIVFRTNLGWQRYWEAVTQLHFMYSKWADAYSQFYAFASVTVLQTRAKGGDGAASKIQRVIDEMSIVENMFYLLSAMGSDRLVHGDTQTMERRAHRGKWREQVVQRADLRRLADLRELPNLVSGSRNSGQKLENGNFSPEYAVREKPPPDVLERLQMSPDRPNTVMHWILFSLAKISKDLDTAPPIQSRMYQELSNGMLGFNNALKIADVPFPFPYAQLLTIVLTMYSLFIPLYITVFTKSMILGPIMTFLLFQGVWCVNEVAKELENPFGTDTNDINVPDFHERFIHALNDIRISNEVDLSGPNLPPAKAPVEDGINAKQSSAAKEPNVEKAVSKPPAPPATTENSAEQKQQPAKQDDRVLQDTVIAPKSAWALRVGAVVDGGAGAEGNSAGPMVAEVFDKRLHVISLRMEQHLANICKEIESIGRVAANTSPLVCGSPRESVLGHVPELDEPKVPLAACPCQPLRVLNLNAPR